MSRLRFPTVTRVLPAAALMSWSWLAAAQGASLQELDCLIEPETVVEVSSAIDGVVDKVLVDRSDRVEPGQALVELESSLEQATVEMARARADRADDIKLKETSLAFAQRKLGRINNLYKRKATSRAQKDEAETEVAQAKLELNQARNDQRLAELELARAEIALEQRTIRSRIDGVVVERYVSPGESVKDRSILRLAQINPLRVEVIAPMELFGSIEKGMRARISLESPQGAEPLYADVSVVDSVIDAPSGTFGVRISLPNPDHQVPSGQRCRVSFEPRTASSRTQIPTY